MTAITGTEGLPRAQYGATLRSHDRVTQADFQAAGLSQHTAPLGRGRMDALFHNKESEVLVVSLHGALDREKYTAPRFERFRTLSDLPFSVLYLSDPALALDPLLSLSWYVGYDEENTVDACVEWIRRAAAASGAKRILLAGSSGGGFGALQMARQLEDAMALVFQPQTVISSYYDAYVSRFAGLCFPTLGPGWEEELGPRASAIEAYRGEGFQRIRYVQNRNDRSHYLRHFKPFIKALGIDLESSAAQDTGVSVRLYDGPRGHKVPSPELFLEELNTALADLMRQGR